MEELFGETVINHKNEKIDIKKEFAGKTIGIYFSAHWCPPCRGFTPLLVEFYKKYNVQKNLEIVFVSSDRDLNSFTSYYGDMPWLAVSFENKDLIVS